MFIFLKLCLAHLIADFVFQCDELYQLKLKNAAGHLLHALTHALVSLLVLFPYLGSPFIWIFVLAISIIHLAQDVVKYRWMPEKRYFIHIFAADQALHFSFLSTILFFPVSSQKMGFPNLPVLDLFYLDDRWTLYLLAFLIATFCGSFALNALSITCFKDSRPDHFISTAEMVQGIFERSVVAGIFLLSSSPAFFILSPAVGVVRLFYGRIRSGRDFLSSFVYGALIGALFRVWLMRQ